MLNARIQDDVHSSIIDARICLALFLANGCSRQYLIFMTYDTLYAVSSTHRGGRGRRAGNKDRGGNEEKKHTENLGVTLAHRFQGSIEDDKVYLVDLAELRALVEQQVSQVFRERFKHFM